MIMASHTHKPNIPPGESDRLGHPLARSDDRNVSIGPLLKEMDMRERKVLGMQR